MKKKKSLTEGKGKEKKKKEKKRKKEKTREKKIRSGRQGYNAKINKKIQKNEKKKKTILPAALGQVRTIPCLAVVPRSLAGNLPHIFRTLAPPNANTTNVLRVQQSKRCQSLASYAVALDVR